MPLDIPSDLQTNLVPKMRNGESPFSSILSDRGFYEADLVIALLHTVSADDDACGVANVGVIKGEPYRGCSLERYCGNSVVPPMMAVSAVRRPSLMR